MRIAVTGVAGLVGRRLVETLAGRDDVEHVLGLDVRPPTGLTTPKLRFRHADVRDAALADALSGVDVVVHLAFQMDPIRDVMAMRSVNVDGSRNVFRAAEAAGVGQVVYLSSVVAYGAHPDNDFPLAEDSPLRLVPQFPYAEHKHEIETWLSGWLQHGERPKVAVLRPAIVLGPGVQNFMTRLLESPRFLVISGHEPPLQFVHLDDVVNAIVHAIDRGLSGPYNVTAEGWLSLDEVAAIVGRRKLEVPEEVAFAAAERLWRLGLGEQPPGLVPFLIHPWVASPVALISTGWQPQHSNRDALDETAREHRPYVAVAGLRAPRRTVRAVSVVLALGAGLTAVQTVRHLQRSRRARRT
jgi:nucleoside-diphosphate-sugar epimerase